MNKKDLLARKDITADDLDRRMLSNLSMVVGYLRHLEENWECKRGDHDWDEWSSRAGGNVEEMGENVFSCRECVKCGQEMPESRIYHRRGTREKNAVTYEEWYKKKMEKMGIVG